MEKIYLEFEAIRKFCVTNCSAYERWPSYYKRRYLEFLSYYALFPKKHWDAVLELGCGIGYQSAFLSKVATHVIATDLDEEDIETHAPGMQKARDLLNHLDVKNVDLISCSAENLPFEDNSFDMVYSSHVLEHIPDQQKALKEIYRVLKPGGIHFCVVPTTMEKIYAFINFYIYLMGRVFHHIGSRLFPTKEKVTSAKSTSSTTSLQQRAASQLKYFPFPAPHGHYKHFLEELRLWTPGNWIKVIEKNTHFKVVQQSTTQCNFLLSLLGSFAPNLGTSVHALTRKIELKLGKWPVIRSMGINTVMICEVGEKKKLIESV
ncbi:MAG: class I SAM-dependent methyltransferase [Bacteroidia bacterium]|jgi:ubiquinone/menaquinone biosynthesis C-methylase UbiE|nr:class I SAM-dependent methyltransferase [Bacteroidia bacterium]